MAYNYYKLLRLSSTASSDEIKVAYRKLAKQYHPDVCEDPRSKETFQLLNTAYKVLMHPQKRKNYDVALRVMQTTGMHAGKAKAVVKAMAMKERAFTHGGYVPIPRKLPKLAIKLLFAYGVFIGAVLLTMTISLIISSMWPVWMGWLGLVGLVLVADGTQGLITNNNSYLLKLGNKVRKLYS